MCVTVDEQAVPKRHSYRDTRSDGDVCDGLMSKLCQRGTAAATHTRTHTRTDARTGARMPDCALRVCSCLFLYASRMIRMLRVVTSKTPFGKGFGVTCVHIPQNSRPRGGTALRRSRRCCHRTAAATVRRQLRQTAARHAR